MPLSSRATYIITLQHFPRNSTPTLSHKLPHDTESTIYTTTPAMPGSNPKSGPPGLLTIPAELLDQMSDYLRTWDLRRLSRVNRKLHEYVKSYLRFRYRRRLECLPNDVILKILGDPNRRGRWGRADSFYQDHVNLARVSQRFYPAVMDSIILHDIRFGKSSLLHYASERGLMTLARRILHPGGNLETRVGNPRKYRSGWNLPPPFSYRDLTPDWIHSDATPLAAAAHEGHEPMVRLLLDAGASQYVHGQRLPLALAISSGHESIAMLLSQGLDSDDVSPNYALPGYDRTYASLLQLACNAKLPKLVRFYLALPLRWPWGISTHLLHNRSVALCHLIMEDMDSYYLCDEDKTVTMNERHDEVYEILILLLEHGANPDALFFYHRCWWMCRHDSPAYRHWRENDVGSEHITARQLAGAHSDPRIKHLFWNRVTGAKPQGSSNHVGWPWMSYSMRSMMPHEFSKGISPCREIRHSGLDEYLDETSEISVDSPNDDDKHEDACSKGATPSMTLGSGDGCIGTPSLTSFPPLRSATKKPVIHSISHQFWAQKPDRVMLDLRPQSSSFPALGTSGRAAKPPASLRFWAEKPHQIMVSSSWNSPREIERVAGIFVRRSEPSNRKYGLVFLNSTYLHKDPYHDMRQQ